MQTHSVGIGNWLPEGSWLPTGVSLLAEHHPGRARDRVSWGHRGGGFFGVRGLWIHLSFVTLGS